MAFNLRLPSLSQITSPIGRVGDSVIGLVEDPIRHFGGPGFPLPKPSQILGDISRSVPPPPDLPDLPRLGR